MVTTVAPLICKHMAQQQSVQSNTPGGSHDWQQPTFAGDREQEEDCKRQKASNRALVTASDQAQVSERM